MRSQMVTRERCPLCGSERIGFYSSDSRRSYLECRVCRLVFVPGRKHISEADEKKRYDLHQNDAADTGYRSYLSRLAGPVLSRLANGSRGLDFGCGPAPVLAEMIREAGHNVSLFDRYYHQDTEIFERKFDFITASEVVEHLRDLRSELERLWSCLKPGGILALMTQFPVQESEFAAWHYKNDATHIRFFPPAAFSWLAGHWGAELEIPEKDVVLLRKKCGPAVLLGSKSGAEPLTLLYRDEQLAAVFKPAGLLSHRSDVDRHAAQNAMHLLRDQLGKWVYPFHRIDRATSGVMVFALDRETGRTMTQAFTEGRVRKHYVAVVRGYAEEAGTIDHPLRDVWDKMTDQKAERNKPGRRAITDYNRLAVTELPFPVGRYQTARFSLLQVSPHTGRYRQIRRHMKHIFHPVIGDTSYGDGKQNDFFRKTFQCRRLLLHAREIEFEHPATGQPVSITAPLDQEFSKILETLGWGGLHLPGSGK